MKNIKIVQKRTKNVRKGKTNVKEGTQNVRWVHNSTPSYILRTIFYVLCIIIHIFDTVFRSLHTLFTFFIPLLHSIYHLSRFLYYIFHSLYTISHIFYLTFSIPSLIFLHPFSNSSKCIVIFFVPSHIFHIICIPLTYFIHFPTFSPFSIFFLLLLCFSHHSYFIHNFPCILYIIYVRKTI